MVYVLVWFPFVQVGCNSNRSSPVSSAVRPESTTTSSPSSILAKGYSTAQLRRELDNRLQKITAAEVSSTGTTFSPLDEEVFMSPVVKEARRRPYIDESLQRLLSLKGQSENRETGQPSSTLQSYSSLELAQAIYDKTKPAYQGAARSQDLVVTPLSIRTRVFAAADAVVALVDSSLLVDNHDGTHTLKTKQFGPTYYICPPDNPEHVLEPFYDQPTAAYCTGFLVSSREGEANLVVTAGHCVLPQLHPLQSVRVVFGYRLEMKAGGYTAVTTIRDEDIFSGRNIVGSRCTVVSNSGRPDCKTCDPDWAIVQLDRAATNHHPARLRQQPVTNGMPLYVIGYPCGLPAKYADGASVADNSDPTYFISPIDTYGGNSGSPLFCADDDSVAGILVSGSPDWQLIDNVCAVSLVCPFTKADCQAESCGGEVANRVTLLSTQIP